MQGKKQTLHVCNCSNRVAGNSAPGRHSRRRTVKQDPGKSQAEFSAVWARTEHIETQVNKQNGHELLDGVIMDTA